MSQGKSIDLLKIKNLPPLPEESIRIIAVVNDDDISIKELVDVLSLSPVLVARLLGLANSAFFGRTGKIFDLRTAIIQVLGLNLVRSLALSIVLNTELKISKCKNFDARFFWNHTLVSALIAEKLSKQIDDQLMLPNIVYTSGLLLNIGLIASIFVYPDELNEVLSKTDRIEGSVLKEMQSEIGKTQYEVGAILLDKWKLPSIYQTVVKQFRQADFKGEEKCLLELLALSHWAAVYIVEKKMDEMPDFSESLKKLSLSEVLFVQVVDSMNENRDDIEGLAAIISG